MRPLQAACAWLLLCLLGGCLERVAAVLPPTVPHSDIPVPQWEYAGSFGGTAVMTTTSTDPWEQRFEEGKFLNLMGICATATEVWACDLGISRIQIFDHMGHLLRTIGAGVPIAGTLPSDEQLYNEEQSINPSLQQKWEESSAGQRWVKDRRGLFKAADVVVLPEGYWLADQMFSSGYGQKARPADCRFYGTDGHLEELVEKDTMFWPNYLAADAMEVACGEDWGNTVWIGGLSDKGLWETKRPADITIAFRSVMAAREKDAGSSRYQFLIDVAGNAGADTDHYDHVGGMQFYQGKLLVCDRQNRRIKVYEARHERPEWGKLLKIINFRKSDGTLRFISPRDLDISADGLIYVLDGERREIAILSPGFERIGTIPGQALDTPHSLSLSPDGHEIFVSDAANNLIHHYVGH